MLIAQRLAAQALGRVCNTWIILPETPSKQVALPLAAFGQVACSRVLGVLFWFNQFVPI
jgi:hypothetical protein